jgi:hypothetical protein
MLVVMVLVSMMHSLCVQAGDAAEQSEGSKKKWFDEKKKRQEEQLAKMGLTPEDAHRLESAEVAEAKYKKKVRTSLTVVCIGGNFEGAAEVAHSFFGCGPGIGGYGSW